MIIITASYHQHSCHGKSEGKDKPNNSESRKLCEAACEDCFSKKQPLKRVGCFEKCIAKEVEEFTCPGKGCIFQGSIISPV